MLNERTQFYLLLLALALGVAGVLGLCLFAVQTLDGTAVPKAVPPKVLKRTLAEDLTVRRKGILGVDFVKVGRARLEKRKKGVLTFGGFNILVLEDLRIVLPPELLEQTQERESAGGSDAGGGEGRELVRRMGVSSAFLKGLGLRDRFSGARIEGLWLGKYVGTNVVHALSARAAEAEPSGLVLRDVTGPQGNYGRAVLTVKDGLKLKVDGGNVVRLD